MRKNLAPGNTSGYLPFALDFLSFLFILSASYLTFVDDIGFGLEVANLYIIVAFAFVAAALSVLLQLLPSVHLRVLILTILLLLFIDIQFDWLQGKVVATGVAIFLTLWILRTHVSQVLAVIFGTTIGVTVGISLFSYSLQMNFSPMPGPDSHNTRLPVYVHIVLDEQIGIEGFDNDTPSHKKVAKEIGTFFVENKFRVFTRAYSPYYRSKDSLASALNLKITENVEHLHSKEAKPHVLIKSSYFENLLAIGYNINVYQSTYMDFCSSIRTRIQKCLTYKHHSISSAAVTGLTDYEKARVVLGLYGKLSLLFRRTRKLYNKKLRGYLGGLGLGIILPDWAGWSGKVGPIATLPIFDTLIKDVSAAPGGAMFFAHLLIPHYPYSVDSACEIRRPVLMWNKRNSEINDSDKANSARSRLARYEEYIPQVRCALLKLEGLLDALKTRGTFEDAIIIVHGDHGSRIVLLEPRMENKDRLSRQDFYDAFSTLYVVKSPGISPGYDTRMMALPELLKNTVSGDINPSAKSEPDTGPTVFLLDRGKPGLQEVPMPYLPITKR